MVQRPVARRKRAGRDDVDESKGDSELDVLLAQLVGLGHHMKLNRRGADRVYAHVGRVELTQDFIEEVQREYGGGHYRGVIYKEDGKYVRHVSFAIEGAPRTGGEATAGAGGDRLSRIESALEKMAEPKDNGAAIERTVALITGIIGAVTPLVAPLLNRPPATGGDVASTLALMQAAEERGERRGTLIGELQAGSGGKPAKRGIVDTLAEYAPKLIGLVERNMDTQREQLRLQAGPRVENAPSPEPKVDPMPVVATYPEGYDWLPALRPFYPRIVQQATLDTDPNVIADFALSQMDEDLRTAVDAATLRPDFLDTMRAELAEVQAVNDDWLKQFLARIVEECAPEEVAAPAGKREAAKSTKKR